MSKKLIDLTGLRFGRLLVIRREGAVKRGTAQPTWLCQCDCGESKIALGASLRGGVVKSCGCIKRENGPRINRSHGMSGSLTYNSWRAMKERCDNPNNSHYAIYGGRGVRYRPEWGSFEHFYADMGDRPRGTTLDRKDPNGEYSKDNCLWATAKEQSRNTTRSVFITWGGKTLCLKDWAKELGILHGALQYRLKHWPFEIAMTASKDYTHNPLRYRGRAVLK